MVSIQHAPAWLEDFQQRVATNEVGSFVFHHNVWDDHLVDGQLRRLYEVFSRKEPTNRSAIIAYFNFETGLRFADETSENLPITGEGDAGEFRSSPMEELFVRLAYSQAQDLEATSPRFFHFLSLFEVRKRTPGYVLEWLRTVLRSGWAREPVCSSLKVQDICIAQDINQGFSATEFTDEVSCEERGKILAKRHANDPFVTMVFEVPKLLAPSATGMGTSSEMGDRQALNHFTWWAQEKKIRANRNLILYMTETLSDLPEELRKGVNGFYNIRIGVPSEEEMPHGIALIRQEYRARQGDISDRDLAFLARGLEFKVVRRILADSYASGESLSAGFLFEQKSKNLIEQTGGLIRLVRHEGHTYDMLGSLEYVVDGIKQTVEFIEAGRWDLVPRGVLLMGPRGTAKSETVKVIAAQSGITCAEMVTIREMWVGQSERNFALCLERIRDNAPIFVIEEEADAKWQNRGMLGDNTGVNQHLTGMMLDFMGDESVKGVVWFFLTNMPHMLDPAMIRSLRMDERYVFTLAGIDDRPGVVRAILRQLEIEIPRLGGPKFVWQLSEEEIVDLAKMMDYEITQGAVKKGPPSGINTTKLTLNGAEIKKVLKNAHRRMFLAGDDVLTFAHVNAELDVTVPEYTAADKAIEDICLGFVDNLNHVPPRLRERVLDRKAEEHGSGGGRSAGRPSSR